MQKKPPSSTEDSSDAAEFQAEPKSESRSATGRRRRQRRMPDTSVPSPCVAVCRYNNEELCKGCLRTPDEIREWIIMSREEKLAVLELLAQRRKSAAS